MMFNRSIQLFFKPSVLSPKWNNSVVSSTPICFNSNSLMTNSLSMSNGDILQFTKFVQKRSFSSKNKDEDDDYDEIPPKKAENTFELPLDSPFRAKHKEILNKHKIFMKTVHPDRFHSRPEYKKLNEENFQKLNHFFDAIEDYIVKAERDHMDELETPYRLRFACLVGEEIRQIKTSFFLPVSIYEGGYHETISQSLLVFQERCVDQLNDELNNVTKVNNKRRGRR